MKKRIGKIVKIIKFDSDYGGHELFIGVGLFMAALTLSKLLGFFYIDSDWFWFIAGIGLMVEGIIEVFKHRKFNSKYKVITREEFERLVGEN